MLSYQHIYHAGNIVDCQKHAILGALLSSLDGFHYIDTHAGRGLYDLASFEAMKIQEYKNGIDRIWSLGNWPKEMRTYQHLLEDLNPDGVCRYYPGSPMVAHAYAKDDDRLDLYEIHPQEVYALEGHMANLPNVRILDESGWDVLTNGISTARQPVILIDPSYEIKTEYLLMSKHVEKALASSAQAIIMIWYPLLKAGRHLEMLELFKKSSVQNMVRTEIHTSTPEDAQGLYGTGMLLINLPEGFDKIVDKLSAWLCHSLGRSTTTTRLR